MKFLIRTGCFLVVVAIQTSIRRAGIILGAIPTILLYTLWYSCSHYLCAKWDVKAFEKAAVKKGMTPGAYASTVFPSTLLDRCEITKDNRQEFEGMLKQNIAGEIITKSEATVLRYMFRREVK